MLLGSLLGVVVFFPLNMAKAVERPWMEAESRYTGDGWFHYRVRSFGAPFMESVNVTTFGPLATNYWTEVGTVQAGWNFTNRFDRKFWEVEVDYPHWQTRPYEANFVARSDWTNYTLGTATLTMSITLYELINYTPYVSVNVVGYWHAPALVPCQESPTNAMPAFFYTNITYNADIEIRQLVRDGQETKGIEFTHASAATFLLEATPDLQNWQNVSYIHGLPGANQWTTSTDLGRWGNFYRLEYVGYGHLPFTNLPPLDLPTSLVSRASTISPEAIPLTAFTENQNLKVRIQTVPGKNYEVRVYEAGVVAWSSRLVAQQKETVVPLPTGQLPAFGIIGAFELR